MKKNWIFVGIICILIGVIAFLVIKMNNDKESKQVSADENSNVIGNVNVNTTNELKQNVVTNEVKNNTTNKTSQKTENKTTTNETANNNQTENQKENVSVSNVNPNDYVGTWGCGRATLEVKKISNNSYDFNIRWSSSAFELSEWSYTCHFDDDTGIMSCNSSGIQKDIVYNENDEATEKIIYKNGSADFSLKNGKITWKDKKENAGEDMEFVKE